MRRLFLAGLFTAGLVAGTSVSWAKTTSDLSGKVTDKSNQDVLPGVTVTITSPQLIGGSKSATTNEKGEYRFPALTPGTYSVTGTMSGFDTTKEEIRVLLGKEAVLNLTMAVTGVTAEVAVVGEAPVVETSSSTVKTSIDDELVQNIPILNRDFLTLATLAPGVNRDPDSTGSININGGRVTDTNFQLDGLNITDAGTGTRGAQVNLDAIQELEVVTNGYNAEYGRAQGGIINVITKSGGNDYHGTGSYYYRGSRFDGSSNDVSISRDARRTAGDCDAAGKPSCDTLVPTQDFNRSDVYLTGEGPIVRDKLWFFATGEYLKNEDAVLGLREEWDAGLTTDTKGLSIFAKGTAQPSQSNTLSVLFNNDPRDLTNSQMGIRGTSSYWTNQVTPDRTEGGWLLNARDTHVVNSSLFIEALAGYQKDKVEAKPKNEGGFFGAALYPSDGIYVERGGRYPFAFALDRNRIEAKVDATYYADWAGSHTFKAGVDAERLNSQQTNDYAPQLFGLDESTWDSSTRYSVRFPSDNTAPVDLDGNGVIDNDPNTFELIGYAFGFDTRQANFNVKGTAVSAYVQDEWQLPKGITLNLGARLDKEVTVQNIGGNVNVAPRFGISWDPKENGKFQVFGNTGLTYDKLFLDSLTYSFSGAIATLYIYPNPYNGFGAAFGIPPQPPFLFRDFDPSHPESGALAAGAASTPDKAIVDPNLKNPYTWYSTLGFKAEVIHDLEMGVSLLHREGKDLLQDIETNKRYDPNAVSTGGLVSIDPNFNHIKLLTNVNSSKYNALQFEINKRFSNRWQLLANYTYSKAQGDGRDYTRLPSAGNNVDGDDPRLFTQEYSVLSYDRTHVVNISGNVNLPLDFQVGWSGVYETGTPYSKLFTINQAAINDGLFPASELRNATYIGGKNTFRLPSLTSIDLHLQKNFNLGSGGAGKNVQILADVFNVLDGDAAITVNQTVQYGDFDHNGTNEFRDVFGKPTQRQFGRRFQLGAKLSF
jgi:outer membrane receptor protein involved in Fe transport